MIKALVCVIWRDLTLYIRHRGEWASPLLFFIMIASLFPIMIGNDPKTLSKLAPFVIWICVVLSLLMSLETIFRSDYQEGTLEQFVLSPYPLSILLFGKCIAHCLAMGFPLLIVAILFGLLLNVSEQGIIVLWVSLLLGIPSLSIVGGIGAALTIGLQRGGILLAILILPLMIPIVIFGANAVAAANQDLPYHSEILLMGAFLLFVLALGPIATAAALRVSIE